MSLASHSSQLPFTPDMLDKKDDDYLLTPAEVASLFRVDVKTVTRWVNAKSNTLTDIKTPGGQRRFKVGEIKALFKAGVEADKQSRPVSDVLAEQAPAGGR